MHKLTTLLMILAVTALSLAVPLSYPQPAHAAFENWAGYDSQTVSAPSSDLTDFTLLVDLSRLSSAWWSNVASDGSDIRFSKGDGTTELAYDLIEWDHGNLEGWARVKWSGTLSSGGGQILRVYAGNDSASAYATGDTYGQHNAYDSNTVLYLPLSSSKNRISGGNHAVTSGDVTFGNVSTGAVGGATSFDGDSDAEISSYTKIANITNEITASIWTYLPTNPEDWDAYFAQSVSTASWGTRFLFNSYNNTKKYRFAVVDENQNSYDVIGPVATLNQWVHLLGRLKTDGSVEFFINGESVGTTTFGGATLNDAISDYHVHIGSQEGVAGQIEADLDSTQIHSIGRSNVWIQQEYDQTSDQASFWGTWGWTTGSSQMASSNYSLISSSINAGGTDFSTSSGYTLHDTVGELATGHSSSTNYQIRAGYRQMSGSTISISTAPDVTLPALGGVTGGTSTATSTWTVTTDSPGGYELSVRASTSPALQTASSSFADYSASTTPDFTFGIASSESAFGFTPEGSDITDKFRDDGSSCNTGSGDTASRCWVGFSTSDSLISSSANSTHPVGADTIVRYQAEIGADRIQTAGTYQAVVTVTAISL